MDLRLISLPGLLWLACAGPAAAFNDPGHLQSVRLVIEGLGEPKDPAEKKLMAACAQLPDLSQELDAAKTYYEALSTSWFDWARWGTSDRLNNAALQRMFAVQQLVHGLTGGDPMALRTAALGTLRGLLQQSRAQAPGPGPGRLEALCAVGLSLHLWGDAFAHTEVLWDGDDQASFLKAKPKMYPTGRGHGLSDGHFPDDMLCSYYTKPLDGYGTLCNQDWMGEPHSRQRQWAIYAMGTRQLVSGKARLDGYFGLVPPDDPRYTPAGVKGLLDALRQAAIKQAHGGIIDSASPDEIDMAVGRQLSLYVNNELKLPPEARFDDDPKGKEFLDEITRISSLGLTDRARPCSEILDLIRSMKGIAALPGARDASCGRIWTVFAKVAISQFVDALPSHPGASPVHTDWESIYRPNDADKSYARPIDCYAAQVGARLTTPNAAAKAQACRFAAPH